METDVERLAELWSMHGSFESFDFNDRPLVETDKSRTIVEALKKGIRVGFVAGSDTHSGRPGGSFKELRPYFGGRCGRIALQGAVSSKRFTADIPTR